MRKVADRARRREGRDAKSGCVTGGRHHDALVTRLVQKSETCRRRKANQVKALIEHDKQIEEVAKRRNHRNGTTRWKRKPKCR